MKRLIFLNFVISVASLAQHGVVQQSGDFSLDFLKKLQGRQKTWAQGQPADALPGADKKQLEEMLDVVDGLDPSADWNKDRSMSKFRQARDALGKHIERVERSWRGWAKDRVQRLQNKIERKKEQLA